MTQSQSDRIQILCADGDADVRTIIGLALELDGRFDFTGIGDGLEALDLLIRAPVPGAILVDPLLPGLPGRELVRLIRTEARFGQVPVIFMTTEANVCRHGHFYEGGATAVLIKPFDPLTLATRIERVMVAEREHH